MAAAVRALLGAAAIAAGAALAGASTCEWLRIRPR